MKYDDLYSAKDAREYLGLTVGQWNYIAHKSKLIRPIPIGERVYDDDTRHTTYLFSRRQLDELKHKMDTAVSINHIEEPVVPLDVEIGQVFSVADAADYLGKTPEAVRAWLYRHEEAPRKKIGNQTVFLLEDVKRMDDPYGLKEEAETA